MTETNREAQPDQTDKSKQIKDEQAGPGPSAQAVREELSPGPRHLSAVQRCTRSRPHRVYSGVLGVPGVQYGKRLPGYCAGCRVVPPVYRREDSSPRYVSKQEQEK